MVTLNINGRDVQVDADPSTPILWALRDNLNMTGTKFGCGMAMCGACTVHLEGQAIRSCVTPISAAVGQKITTIEAMSADKVGKAVQDAWVKHDQAIRSCVTPISAAVGQKITTIEAMSADKVGKAVQDAWVKHDVPQCGYCQSGQVMSATALLRTNKAPSDADIDNAMSGNICRCGTYQRIRAAIKDAAKSIA